MSHANKSAFSPERRIIVAITGASGSIYGLRLLTALLARPMEVFLLISRAGRRVMAHETDFTGDDIADFLRAQGANLHADARLREFSPDDLFAPPASGSFRHGGMAVAPCSMKTLGAVMSGAANDLVLRAADVCLKERRPLVLLTRETPLSLIHLENMRRAVMAGATVMPPCPAFYARPKTVDEIVDATVARLLDQLGIDNDLMRRWGEDEDV
ncbi:MAG: UbiX family flavin prenyltransferase [Desulfococcaceae bacterium]